MDTELEKLAAALGLSREDVATMTQRERKNVDGTLAGLSEDERRCCLGMLGASPDDVAVFLEQRRGAL